MKQKYQVELLRIWPYWAVTVHSIDEFRQIVESGDHEPADKYRIKDHPSHKDFSTIKGYCFPVHPFFHLEQLFAYRCAKETMFALAMLAGCIYFIWLLCISISADHIESLEGLITSSDLINGVIWQLNFFFKHATWVLILIKIVLLVHLMLFACLSLISLNTLRVQYDTWLRKGPGRLRY